MVLVRQWSSPKNQGQKQKNNNKNLGKEKLTDENLYLIKKMNL